MARTRRQNRRTRTTRTTRRTRWTRPTWPGAVLAALTVVVSGSGWWILVHDAGGDDVGTELALGFGAFAGASLVSSVWQLTTRPGGVASRFGAMARLRTTDSIATRGGALCWPSRGLWTLPVLQIPLFALALPVAYRTSPGDHTILVVLLLYTLFLAWAGMFAAILVWMLLLVPLVGLGRAGWQLVRGRPLDDGQQFGLVVGALLLGIATFATGIVLGAGDRSNEIWVFLGGGDQSSPWLWVGRGGLLVVVLTIVTTGWYFTRQARRASPPPARTTRRSTRAR